MKHCPKCNTDKELSEFYDCPSRYDGKRAYCKSCSSIINRSKRDYFREYSRNKYATDEDFRNRVKKDREKYRKRNKKKASVQQTLHIARYKGLIRKSPCFICGDNNSQAHHPDYSKPLEVIWLCPLHHRRLHIK